MAFVSLFFWTLLLLSVLILNFSAEANDYGHRSCTTFSCGKLGKLSFPFAETSNPLCGLILVDGCNDAVQRVQLVEGASWNEVDSISQNTTSYTLQILDEALQNHLQSKKCEAISNLTLPSSPHVSFQIVTPNITMFKCCKTLMFPHNFTYKQTRCGRYNIYHSNPESPLPGFSNLSLCSVLQLPMNRNEKCDDVFEMITASYALKIEVSTSCLKCFNHGGQCQLDDVGRFRCANVTVGHRRPLLATAAVTSAVIIGVFLALCCCIRHMFSHDNSICLWKKEKQNRQNIEAILSNYGPLAPKRYTFSDIRHMTNSFRCKLGEGGYGSVYEGKLPDGCLVAVKVLHELKINTISEDFINEVSIISRTSHVNVVSLLGFCFEGSRRALVYEFMSKGSLEKFIYDENSMKIDFQLGWDKLYQIAVGTARGLEYLHRGCNMRILHFDIKPQNILLDDEFCPKISDFGLAKICPRKDSIISMLSARGTAGYIAPEVFCRSFGGVSHKSDVYSYGMLVLEMVGGRRKTNFEVEQKSETYVPHLLYKKLEVDFNELGLKGIANDQDKESVRKMILVGLWCIQTDPADRPPMSRVVEMLEGNVEFLRIPPKPFLSSPPRSGATSTTTIESWTFSED